MQGSCLDLVAWKLTLSEKQSQVDSIIVHVASGTLSSWHHKKKKKKKKEKKKKKKVKKEIKGRQIVTKDTTVRAITQRIILPNLFPLFFRF